MQTCPWRVFRTEQSRAIFPEAVPRFCPSPSWREVSMDCSWGWGTLQAQPLRVEKEVRDQFGGRLRAVGSKLTVWLMGEV